MCYCDFSISLEIGTCVLAALALVAIIVFLCTRRKFTRKGFDVDECDFGLSGGSVHLSCNLTHRQIAYKIWVDIKTRTIAVKIDLDKDVIKVVNDSYHECFIQTRELLKEIPINKLENDDELVKLIVEFLNGVLRPYLTKWGVLFSDWYESERKNNSELNPIEIQRKYEHYDEMTKDLLEVNEKVITYTENLYKIAFQKGKRIKK